MTENEVATVIVDCAVEVARTLGGPGLLEGVYAEALAWELQQHGLFVATQLAVPVLYKGRQLGSSLRLDLLVEKKVIIETKATTDYNEIFEVQALTYLRLMKLKLALVINFSERYVKNGIHRVVNGL